MNIAVIYATKTKHSAKYAGAVAKTLGVDALDIADSPELSGVDLLFIAGGIYGGVSSPELLEYVKGLDQSKARKAALVTSCASKKQKQDAVRTALNESGINVVDEIVLPGSILFVRAGHPNNKDLKEAADFAEKVANIEV